MMSSRDLFSTTSALSRQGVCDRRVSSRRECCSVLAGSSLAEAEGFVRPHDRRTDGNAIVAPHAARAQAQPERLDIVRGVQHQKQRTSEKRTARPALRDTFQTAVTSMSIVTLKKGCPYLRNHA